MAWNDDLEVGSAAYNIAASTHKRIRVLAGPGTGKSFAMKRRIARLLEEKITPGGILAVTFTRVAAEDLHRELGSLKVPGAEALQGRTLHSVAMSILTRNHVLGVLGRTPRSLNEYELEPMLTDLSSLHGNKHKRRRLMNAYGAAWSRLQTQDPGFARSATDQAFVDELVSWLILHNAMLMDEIVPHLFQYLKNNPGAPERSEYSHILVDEYQDLNRAEQDSLGFLAEGGEICVVGDDDQSIYRFRHAHPEGIRQWATLAPTDEHAIDECRRCPTTVVAMANTLIAKNTDRLGTAMTELAANGPGEVEVRQYSTADRETDAVATKIASLVKSGVAPQEIIVLAQRRAFANPIFHKLREYGVPTKSYYAETELETLEAQERFAILKLLLNKEDRVALRWLLGRGRADWHTTSYMRVLEYVKSNNITPWLALNALAAGTLKINYTGSLVERFREIQAELASLESAADFKTFLQLWLPASPKTELLAETVGKCVDKANSPQELYDAVYDLITQPEIPMEVAEVRVMSLHKSKGLSSPYVFIVGCVEGLLPTAANPKLSATQQLAQLQEDRRLFYVGITRVKSEPKKGKVGYLALTHSQRMAAADAFDSQIVPVRVQRGIAYLQPSRFLAEMQPHVPAAQFNTPL